MKYYKYLLPLLLVACASSAQPIEPIAYVALGDSYTEGTGVESQEAWPVVLTNHLQEEGVPITLKANLGRAGWTSADALKGQLPLLKQQEPNFVTVFIGANDSFQGVPVTEFEANLRTIVQEVLAIVPNSNRLVLVNIPDYSKTPTGIAYARGGDIVKNFPEYNAVVKQIATEFTVPLADVHSTSNRFFLDVSLVAEDGLHPSAKGHILWESVIYPVVKRALK